MAQLMISEDIDRLHEALKRTAVIIVVLILCANRLDPFISKELQSRWNVFSCMIYRLGVTIKYLCYTKLKLKD